MPIQLPPRYSALKSRTLRIQLMLCTALTGVALPLNAFGQALNVNTPRVEDGTTPVTSNDEINVNSGGSITFTGTATIDADTDNSGTNNEVNLNGGTITVDAGAGNNLTFVNDALNVSPAGNFAVVSGGVSGITDLTITSNETDALSIATGTTLSAGTVGARAGTLTVGGLLQATNPVALSGVSILDLDGTVQGAITTTSTTRLSGTVTEDFTQNDNIGARTTVDGASTVQGMMDIDTGSLIVDQSLTATGGLDIAGPAVYDQNALVTGNVTTASSNARIGAGINGSLTQTGGRVTIDGDGTVTGAVTVSDGTFVVDSGRTLTVSSDLNNASTLDMNGTVTGNINNTKTARIDGTVNGTFTQNGNVGGNTVIDGASTITGLVDIQTGSLVVNDTLQADSQISLAGATTYDQNSTLTGNIDTASRNARISSNISGTLTQTAGQTNIDGDSTVTGAVTVTGGTLTVDSGRTLTASGDITNAGTFDVNGVSTGDITNTGTVLLSGTTNGTLTQNTNIGARTIVDGPSTVSGAIDIDTGSLTVDSTLDATGGIDVAGAAAYDQNAIVNGNVTTASSNAKIANSIDGSLTQTGGRINIDGTTAVSGPITISDGTFTVDDGRILTATGGLSNASTFDMNGTTNGNITNTKTARIDGRVDGTFTQNGVAGSNTIVDGPSTITGLVDIDTGSLVVNGTLATNGGVDLANATTYDQNAAVTGNVTTASANARIGSDITGTLTQTAGRTNIDGDSTVTGPVTVSGGTLVVDTGRTLTARRGVSNAGTLDVNGVVTGNVVNTGAATLAGTVNGTFAQNTNAGATTVVDGAATVVTGPVDIDTGSLTVNGPLTANGGVDIAAAATYDQNRAVTGNVVTASSNADIGSNITGTLTQTAGQTNIDGNSIVTGPVTVSGGTLAVDAGQTLTAQGGVDNAATLDVNGTVTGNVVNTGAATLAGTVNGTFAQNASAAASTTVDGASTVTGPVDIDTGSLTVNGPLAANGGVDIAAAATYDQNAAVTGNVVTASGNADIGGNITGTLTQTAGQTNIDGNSTVIGPVTVSGGTLAVDAGQTLTARGGVDNAGTFDVNGTVNGTVANTGTTTLAGTVNGAIDNGPTGRLSAIGTGGAVNGVITNRGAFTVGTGTTLAATRLEQRGGTASILGRFNGDVANGEGQSIRLENGIIGGAYTGTGATLNVVGNSAIGGAAGGGRFALDTVRGVTTDNLTIGGPLSRNNVFDLDVNTGTPGSNVDTITLANGSNVTGVQTLNFDNSGVSLQTTPVDVVIAQTGTAPLQNFQVGTQAFTGGTTVTELQQTANNIGYTVTASPAIGSVVGSVATTDTLLNVVVNRPSSAFVVAPAAVDEDGCEYAGWSRVFGGRATGETDTTDPLRTRTTSVDVDYYGLVAGADFGCYDGGANGWNLVFGPQVGYNSGSTTADVPSVGTVAASRTKSDVEQFAVGGYLVANKGRFVADAQLTYGWTDYSITNEAVSLNDSEISAKALTFGANARYVVPLNETGLLTFIPGVGVSVSHVEYSDLEFLNNAGRLEIDDHVQLTGLVSGTIQHTFNGSDGTSQHKVRGTLTGYGDFSGDRESVFSVGGGSQKQTTEGLDLFGELSLGYTYTSISTALQQIGATQLDLQLRGDARYGSNLEGLGVAAEMRLHF